MSNHTKLHELADRCGILRGYEGVDKRWHTTSDATMELLLAAMGVDASSEEAAARELHQRGPSELIKETTVATSACLPAMEVLGERRVFGLSVNLYTVRSATNWGIGDLGDLSRVVAWAARAGAAFVAINPLQAMVRRGDGNPYYPSSRLFLDPIYLDVELVPEFRDSPQAREMLAAEEARRRIEAVRTSADVQWQEVAEIKDAALRALHQTFAAGLTGVSRRREFDDFQRGEGAALRDFATYCALAAQFDGDSTDWRNWPAEYRRADSAAVESFRRANGAAVEYFAWLQFEIDRQLGQVAASARAAGMSLGLLGDLPVGCAPGGSDTWAHPEIFARRVSIGAPPDAYATAGQDWGLAALHPGGLAADRGDGYWGRMLRHAMRHGGALRLDHAMGVERQFWIPDGASPAQGAYVSYPTQQMIRALAAASRAQRCIVVAEDLGTVPAHFRDRLKSWAVLRNQILYFERAGNRFSVPQAYDVDALVAANTHDLPPLKGYWNGTDLTLRRRAGLLGEDELAAELSKRNDSCRALVAMLCEHGIVALDWQPAAPADLALPVHVYLASTRSRLLAIAVDDLGGEEEPVNVPGASQRQHRSWVRRMQMPLEDLCTDAAIASQLAQIAAARNRVI